MPTHAPADKAAAAGGGGGGGDEEAVEAVEAVEGRTEARAEARALNGCVVLSAAATAAPGTALPAVASSASG